MRIVGMFGLAVAALLLAGGGAEAGAFCAYYNGGGTNCGFHTFQQCLTGVSGVGGTCSANPRFRVYRRDRGY